MQTHASWIPSVCKYSKNVGQHTHTAHRIRLRYATIQTVESTTKRTNCTYVSCEWLYSELARSFTVIYNLLCNPFCPEVNKWCFWGLVLNEKRKHTLQLQFKRAIQMSDLMSSTALSAIRLWLFFPFNWSHLVCGVGARTLRDHCLVVARSSCLSCRLYTIVEHNWQATSDRKLRKSTACRVQTTDSMNREPLRPWYDIYGI